MQILIVNYILLLIVILLVAGFIFKPNLNDWTSKYIGILIICFIVVSILSLISTNYIYHGEILLSLKYKTKNFIQKNVIDPYLY